MIDNEVKLFIYKKIVDGDLKKFIAQSNITPSGGGARDLRFSPADVFFPIFAKMFQKTDAKGNLKGQFSWVDKDTGRKFTTAVTIFKPTDSRPNEIRIGSVNECFPQKIIPKDASDCILLIVYDSDNNVYPHFITERSLIKDDWDKLVSTEILKGLYAKRSSKTTPMGYYDVALKEGYTNGRIR